MKKANWENLKYLLYVTRYGTYQNAADALAVDVTTVQRKIKALELYLNATLLKKSGRRIKPTEYAKYALAHIEQIEELTEKLFNQEVEKQNKIAGVLRIAICGPVFGELFAKHLIAYKRLNPALKIKLKIDDEVHSLTFKDVDIAIRVTDSPPEHLVGKKICSAPWYMCASNDYLRNKTTPRNLEELEGHTIITLDHEEVAIPSFARLNQHFDIRKPNVICSNSFSMHLKLIQEGAGLGMLEKPLIQQSKLQTLFPIKNKVENSIWLLYRSGSSSKKIISDFARYIYIKLKDEHKVKAV